MPAGRRPPSVPGATDDPGRGRGDPVQRVRHPGAAPGAGRLRARARLHPGVLHRAAPDPVRPHCRDVQVLQRLHPARGAVLPARRQPDERGRHHRSPGATVPGRGRPPAGRARAHQRHGQHAVRRHLGLLDRRRCRDRLAADSADEEAGLRSGLLGRDHRLLLGHGGDHPALDPDGGLGRADERLDRRPVPRGRRARAIDRPLDDGHGLRLRQALRLSDLRPLLARRVRARAGPGAARADDAGDHRRRHRRRLLHPDRGLGGRGPLLAPDRHVRVPHGRAEKAGRRALRLQPASPRFPSSASVPRPPSAGRLPTSRSRARWCTRSS